MRRRVQGVWRRRGAVEDVARLNGTGWVGGWDGVGGAGRGWGCWRTGLAGWGLAVLGREEG